MTSCKSSAALGGGLVIGFYLPYGGGRSALAQAPQKMVYPPNAFLRIGKDNTVTVVVKHLEFGQGVQTSLPMLICEELECDWTKVKTELAPAGPVYGNVFWGGMQSTGGSSSVANSCDQLRTVGAQARTMLMQAAADAVEGEARGAARREGLRRSAPAARSASFGQLAEAAMKLPVPENVKLKDREGLQAHRQAHAAPRLGREGRRQDGVRHRREAPQPAHRGGRCIRRSSAPR